MMAPNVSTGVFQEGAFHFPVRVYYEDTDQQGIVFYANYLRYLERGRTEFLRHFGAAPKDVADKYDRVFVVARVDISYLSSATLDDLLSVQTSIQKFGRVKLLMQQDIYRGDEKIVSAQVTLAVVNGEGRPAALNKDLQDQLNPST